ncbi:hypothetical protein CCR75_007397 [Bremia lactucae]|uniref:ADP-ribosylation factor-like protein 6-interacting protein 4 n=1 Tax=Bremia lactucae TaxID=4779 RepID=A0A976IK85_BRELC|nr:hypothetical protein CCR75_007397 [Bremia lactucae]
MTEYRHSRRPPSTDPRHKRRSRSKSRSASSVASPKHIRRRHRGEHGCHDRHEKAKGAEKEKFENRREAKHRSRMWTVVDSESGAASSLKQEVRKIRDVRRSSCSKHQSPSRSPSFKSLLDSDSKNSESSYDKSSSKRKRKHIKSEKDKKRRKKDKKKKDKTSKKSSKKSALNQDEYGKYGILHESDFHSKSVSFQAWLRNVKKMGEFNGPKWEAMELFKEYMEDFNTCTLPHEKYYDIEKYEMLQYQKQQRKAHAKLESASDMAMDIQADEDRVRRERQALREKKEKEEFRLVLQLMDKEKIEAMREQERLRAQMQMFYKSGNVEEARRLEQLINKVDEDPRLNR